MKTILKLKTLVLILCSLTQPAMGFVEAPQCAPRLEWSESENVVRSYAIASIFTFALVSAACQELVRAAHEELREKMDVQRERCMGATPSDGSPEFTEGGIEEIETNPIGSEQYVCQIDYAGLLLTYRLRQTATCMTRLNECQSPDPRCPSQDLWAENREASAYGMWGPLAGSGQLVCDGVTNSANRRLNVKVDDDEARCNATQIQGGHTEFERSNRGGRDCVNEGIFMSATATEETRCRFIPDEC